MRKGRKSVGCHVSVVVAALAVVALAVVAVAACCFCSCLLLWVVDSTN